MRPPDGLGHRFLVHLQAGQAADDRWQLPEAKEVALIWFIVITNHKQIRFPNKVKCVGFIVMHLN